MPVTQTWTALPHGTDGTVLRLSAFVSFRLTTADGGPALLSDPDFADVAGWADTVAGLSFSVAVGGTAVPATVVSATPSAPLWAALFPPADTAVSPYEPQDFSTNPRSSYSLLATHGLLKSLHTTAGLSSPGTPPAWFGGDGQRGPAGRLLEAFVIDREAARNSQLGGVAASQLTPTQQLGQLVGFYARTGDAPMTPTPAPTPDQLRAAFDVHTVLSMLGDHPSLLRPAGLVVDLTVDVGAVPAGAPGGPPVGIRVLPTWTPVSAGMAAPRSPVTMAVWDGADFTAASAGGLIEDGYLRLEPNVDGVSHFGLVEVDVDGGVLKAVHFADNLVQLGEQGSTRAGAPAGLPALRSAGWSLVHDGRAQDLASTFAANTATEAVLAEDPALVSLYAENLVRGYRLDVEDSAGGGWRSLCRRDVSYHFVNDPDLDAPFTHLADEGFIQLGVTSAAKAPDEPAVTAADTLYIHESVARWEGWSLVARRPGLAVSHEADPATPPESGDQESGTSAGLVATIAAAPNSLPRLRVGHGYRIRARVVDLAGDSPDPGDPVTAHAIPVPDPGAVYHRYEPVSAPAVVLRTPLGMASPGESLLRLVIRTFNADPSLDTTPAAGEAGRHLAPPRTSVAMAESLGLLDGPDGRPLAALYPDLVARDAAQLPLDTTSTPPVPIEAVDTFALPYLGDPLARGVAFRDLPGTAALSGPGSTSGTAAATRTVLTGAELVTTALAGIAPRPGSATLVGYRGTWPEIAPFRLVLAEGDGPPVWDDPGGALRVFVAKSGVATTAMSSVLDAADLQLMGVWEWLRQAVEPGPNLTDLDVDSQLRLDELIGLISELSVEGGLWQLTPARQVVLVHAVQQPLGTPVVSLLRAGRAAGATAAGLLGRLHIHGASTDTVTLDAVWTDPVDDPTQPAPATVTATAVATQLSIDDPAGGPVLQAGTVVGRYDAASDTLVLGGGYGQAGPLHELHDTKHHTVTYTPTSASRFREYFPPDVPGGCSRPGVGATVAVPASRRPDPPLLRYVVPSFGWQRAEGTNLRTSRRQGGLRVFLDRPWYSSGDGELLGVLTWPGSLPEARQDFLSHYVSRLGSDPVYPSTQVVPSSISPDSFTLASATETSLTLGELPADAVDVAGHTVTFDAERGLWTADLTLDIGDAYHPWVRLALVRYQPTAIDTAKLSRVVLADFAALPMDRGLLLTYDPYLPDVIAVTVSGHSYTRTAGDGNTPPPGGSVVEVTVDARIDAVADEVLGWQSAAVGVTADTDVSAEDILWHGHVAMPADRAPGQYRIVVSEYETLLADPVSLVVHPIPGQAAAAGPADGPAPAEAAGEQAAPGQFFFGPRPTRRLVYRDSLTV